MERCLSLLAGGISERVNVDDYIRTAGYGPEKLHHLVHLSYEKGALISCSLGGTHRQEAVKQRLQDRHAYTLTGVTQVWVYSVSAVQYQRVLA